MASIAGIDLGTVKSEKQTKSSGLYAQPIPYSDSSDALIMDIMGTQRIITVDGVKVGTKAELKSFISFIEGLQNGQQASAIFVSSLVDATRNVLIQEFTWTWVEADVNEIDYRLTLIEGSVIDS